MPMYTHATGVRLLICALALSVVACTPAPSPEPSQTPSLAASPSAAAGLMTLSSPAFADGAAIPMRFTCDGEEVSPPLAWDNAPDGTGAFALFVEDPDANRFVHWTLTNIPADLRALPEGEGDAIGAPGYTSRDATGWVGPCPPSGEHHYLFTLYALSEPILCPSLSDICNISEFYSGVEQALASALLTGVYARGN